MTDSPAPAATKPPSGGRGGGLLRASAVFSGLTLVSRLLGFVRDLAVTARMGASATPAADAYNTALAFPNLFRRIFAEGAFAAAFVPAYSRSLEQDGEAVADRLAADAMATLAAATIGLTVAAQLAMPWLMYAINPGYASDPVKFKLAVVLTQISMPYLPCMAVVALMSGVLNARGRFALSAAAPILLNLFTLAFIVPQANAVDAAVWGSWGVLAAGVAQGLLLWWGLKRTGAKVHWRLPRLTPEVKALIALAVPGAIAASATQVNIFVSGVLASNIPGARSWLATADRLYQLPLGLVGVAIGVALLPRLSRSVSAGDREDAQGAMDQALTFAMALTLPAAAALVAIPFFLSDALYVRGEFTVYDAQQTAGALMFYGLGTPAFVLAQLYSRAFFARQDTRTPMRSALISVAVNIAAGLALFPFIGVRGIAAGTALAAWVNVLQMAWLLHRRGDYAPTPATASRLARILLASGLMGALLALASWQRPVLEGLTGVLGFGGKELALLLTVGVAGGLAYPALLFAVRGVTVADVRQALRRPPAGREIEQDLGKTPAGPGLL